MTDIAHVDISELDLKDLKARFFDELRKKEIAEKNIGILVKAIEARESEDVRS